MPVRFWPALPKIMNAIQETLDILQEECAEVIVEVSKCRRFGLDSEHYKTHLPHRAMLTQEIGDVLAMVDILIEKGVIDGEEIATAMVLKREKLKEWSTIFSNDD